MRPRLASLTLLTLLLLAVGEVLRAQQTTATEEDRKRQFLKAREEMHTIPATPAASATPGPKPRPRAHATPAPEPPRPVATPIPATPWPKPPVTRVEPRVTPRPHEKESAPRGLARVTPAPVTPVTVPLPGPLPDTVTAGAPAAPIPLPAAVPVAAPAPAPVTIEKSGYEQERGLQPAPPAGWFTRWKYLSRYVRDQIDRAPVQKRRWRYIVVHNSGTRQGNARAFDYYHLHVRHMPNGLAYHFVVGNGTSSGDGEIEIGNRWRRQLAGGHVHSDYLNNISLGICLVGDFNHETPTARQLAATDELIRYLRQRVGPIDRRAAIVKAHREINPPRWPTDCPGDRFPYRWVHQYD